MFSNSGCSLTVQFGCLQIQMVLEWTSAVGVNLLAGVPGPHGLTPLHLAAVMKDGASLAALLTGMLHTVSCGLEVLSINLTFTPCLPL